MIRRAFKAPHRPGWKPLALAFGCGVLGALGQAPWGLWPVALAGFAALYWMHRHAISSAHAAWLGWAGGTGYFALSLFWIVEPFLVDLARHGWMAPFALALMAGGLALLWAAAFWAAARVGGAWALAVCWTAAEMLRAVLFTGFPWATVGHIWADHPMAQIAALGGVPLLTIVTLQIAAGPSLARPFIGGALSLALLASGWSYGAFVLNAKSSQLTEQVVRLVQPNAPQHLKWDPDHIPTILKRGLDLTSAPAAQPLDLVIWPETSIAYPLDASPNTLKAVTQAARGVPVIVGGNDRSEAGWHNTLLHLNPDGSRAQTYYKSHLVPFGEYIPMGEVLAKVGITGLAARHGGGFAAGPGPALLDLPGIGKALPLICYELIFPRNLRGLERPNLLLQITNDAWFGTISGPYQHLAQARLRAIEQGLPLVRAANTGVSAVVDPWGRILAQTKLGEAAYLDHAVPAPTQATFYVWAGDWPMRALLLVLLVAQIIARTRRVD